MRQRFCRVCSGWHELDSWPRKCYVIKEHSRSDTLSIPYFKKDQIEPVMSMADGKTYDSLSALRRTYRADGNPQGKEYVEIGNESCLDQSWSPRQVTDAEINEIIEKSEAQVASGNVPQLVNLSDR